jgi:hypothetical protein
MAGDLQQFIQLSLTVMRTGNGKRKAEDDRPAARQKPSKSRDSALLRTAPCKMTQ